MHICVHVYMYNILHYTLYTFVGTVLLWNAHKFDVLKLDSGMKLVLFAHCITYTRNHIVHVYADTVGCFLITNIC